MLLFSLLSQTRSLTSRRPISISLQTPFKVRKSSIFFKSSLSKLRMYADHSDGLSQEIKSSFQKIWKSVIVTFKGLFERPKREELLSQFKNSTDTVINSIVRNSQEGEFGKRGEELIVAAVILVSFIFLGVHPLIGFVFHFSGLISFLYGLVVISASVIDMKDQLSIYLIPPSNQRLITSGMYQIVRHPMYGGLLNVCTGIALLHSSAEKLLITIALGFLLVLFDSPIYFLLIID